MRFGLWSLKNSSRSSDANRRRSKMAYKILSKRGDWLVQVQRGGMRATRRGNGGEAAARKVEAQLVLQIEERLSRRKAAELLGLDPEAADDPETGSMTPPTLAEFLKTRWASHARLVQNETTRRTTATHVRYIAYFLGDLRIDKIRVEGFRIFGSAFEMPLTPGLNVLVGENDSGKTAIIDAIRFALGTTSQDFLRVEDTDLHIAVDKRATEFIIQCKFEGIDQEAGGALLEHLTYEDGKVCLYVTFRATRNEALAPRRRIFPQSRKRISWMLSVVCA